MLGRAAAGIGCRVEGNSALNRIGLRKLVGNLKTQLGEAQHGYKQQKMGLGVRKCNAQGYVFVGDTCVGRCVHACRMSQVGSSVTEEHAMEEQEHSHSQCQPPSQPRPRASEAMLAAYGDLRGALWVLIALHRRGAPVRDVAERMLQLGRRLAALVGEICPEAGQAFGTVFAARRLDAAGPSVLEAALAVEAALDFVWEDSNQLSQLSINSAPGC